MEQLIDAVYRALPTNEADAVNISTLCVRLSAHSELLACDSTKTKAQKVRRNLNKLEINKVDKFHTVQHGKEIRYWKTAEPEQQLGYLLQELSLLQDVIKQRLTVGLQQQLDDVMRKTANKGSWLRKIYIASSSIWKPPKLDSTVTSVVYQAIEEDRVFSCDYTTLKGRTRRITLVPWGLMTKAEKVYVVAIERGSEKPAPVTYALMSIQNAELGDNLTLREGLPANTDLRTYCEMHQIGVFGAGSEEIQLVVRFYGNAGRRLNETPLSDDMQVNELSHDCREVTATVRNTVELRKYLRGFGEQAEVIAPEELRQQMVVELLTWLARYQNH